MARPEAQQGAEMANVAHPMDVATLRDRILSSLDDDKAEEIVTIDLRGKSEMADYMVICSGRSARQVGAIAQHLADRLKTEFGRLCKVEGQETGDWVLIDSGDVVVHVFRPKCASSISSRRCGWTPPRPPAVNRRAPCGSISAPSGGCVPDPRRT